MSDLLEITTKLSARLPELERRLSKLGSTFHPRLLPRGLFSDACSVDTCIDAIKRDIATVLREQKGSLAHYLVSRIHQQISVLVRICQRYPKEKSQLENKTSLDVMSTRVQWLENRSDARQKLLLQKKAVSLQLKEQTKQTVLNALQLELDDIERELEPYIDIFKKGNT